MLQRGTNGITGLCLLCLLVAGCRNPLSVNVTVAFEVAQPPRVGPATITLRVTDESGQPLSGAHINLEGNMSHAGMVPVFADAVEFEPGLYRSNIELTMAGDWVISAHLTLPDGLKVVRQFEIKGVAPA